MEIDPNTLTLPADLIRDLESRGLITRTFRRLDLERQTAVIQAVLAEAGVKGPASITMRDVALRSGVSIGSLYQYFGSRENLIAFAGELAVRTTVELFRYYQPVLAMMPLDSAIRSYLEEGVAWSTQQAELLRFFAAAAYRDESGSAEQVVRPVAGVMREMVRDMLVHALERGEIRADVDLEAVTGILNTLLIALGDAQLIPRLNVYYQVYSADVSPGRVMDALIRLLNTGLRGEPPQ